MKIYQILLFAMTTVSMIAPTIARAKQTAVNQAETKGVNQHATTTPKINSFQTRQLDFDVTFRGTKVGFFRQIEKIYSDGRIDATSHSSSKISILGRTYDNVSKAEYSYMPDGKLVRFTIDNTERNNRVQVSGQREPSGMSVIHTAKGKTTKNLFPYHEFDATSRDLYLPQASIGTRINRKHISLEQGKITQQNILYKRKFQHKIGSQSLDLTEIEAKGSRGTAVLWISPKGRMVKLSVKIFIFGTLEFQLVNVSGQPIA